MPARNGAQANHAKPRTELKKWPAYFQELGYEVVAFGKVAHYRHTGDYGFDHFAHDTFHDHAGIPAAVEFLRNRPRRDVHAGTCGGRQNYTHRPIRVCGALTAAAGLCQRDRLAEPQRQDCQYAKRVQTYPVFHLHLPKRYVHYRPFRTSLMTSPL